MPPLHPPLDEGAVRAAIPPGVVALEDVVGVNQEGAWLCVRLALDNPPRAVLRSVHAAVAAAFPRRNVEIRTARAVFRGGAGFGEGRHVIAVLGGKGGVGKSTVAVNLALALAAMGERAGLLDADINAPDIPHMLGVRAMSPARRNALWSSDVAPPSAWRHPHRRYGLEVMSVGFEVPERYPPRITSRLLTSTLLRHLMFEVAWSTDIVVVDAPPGTGEELQVIAGELPLSGAIFVTTPQDLAQMDAERTLSLLQERSVPVIGLVKNMASLTCPHCAQNIDMFAGSRRLEDAGVRTLAEIPFDVSVSTAVDRGMPIVLADPAGPLAYQFAKIGALTRSWLRGPSGT